MSGALAELLKDASVPLRHMTPTRREILFRRMDEARADYIAGKLADGDEFEHELDRLIEYAFCAPTRWVTS